MLGGVLWGDAAMDIFERAQWGYLCECWKDQKADAAASVEETAASRVMAWQSQEQENEKKEQAYPSSCKKVICTLTALPS